MVGIDRAVVWIVVAGGTVTPCRIPITGAPDVPSTCDQNDTVAMMSPPFLVVPFVVIIAEGRVFWVGPGFASLNAASTSKLHTRDSQIGLAWQIKVLCTKRIYLCL